MNAKWVHLYEILLAKVKYSEWKMRLSGNEVMGGGVLLSATGHERNFLGVIEMFCIFTIDEVTHVM